MSGGAAAGGPSGARDAAPPAAIIVSGGDRFLTPEIVVRASPAKPEAPACTPAGPPASLVRRAWERWKRIAHAIGRFQTMVLMTLLYFTFIPIFSLIKLKDPLRIRKAIEPGRSSYWEDRGEHGKPQPLERHVSPF